MSIPDSIYEFQSIQTWATEDKDLATLSEGDLELLQGYTQNANVTAGGGWGC